MGLNLCTLVALAHPAALLLRSFCVGPGPSCPAIDTQPEPGSVRSAAGEVMLHSLLEGDLLRTLSPAGGVPCTYVACSSSEQQVAAAGEDGSVRVWDGATGTLQGTHQLHEARTCLPVSFTLSPACQTSASRPWTCRLR